MKHTLAHAALEFRLGCRESRGGLVLITRCDRRLDFLHESPDSADSGSIGLGSPQRLAVSLFSGFMVSHQNDLIQRQSKGAGYTALRCSRQADVDVLPPQESMGDRNAMPCWHGETT